MIGLLFTPLIVFAILLIAAFTSRAGLTLDKSLKITDFISISTTTLLAVVLQIFVTKRGKVTEAEKGLLIAQVSSILKKSEELRVTLDRSLGSQSLQDQFTLITQAFDQISEEVSSLRESLEQSHCNELADSCDAIVNDFLFYKAAITGGSFPMSPLNFGTISRASSFRIRMDRGVRFTRFRDCEVLTFAILVSWDAI